MPEAAASTFACSGCAKQYKWKQELAGRKVKCKCGQVIQIPIADPALSAAANSAEEDSPLAAMEAMAATKHVEIPRQEDDLYDIAEPEKPKARPARAQSIAAAGIGAATVAAPMLGYSRAPVADDREDNDPNAIKELYVPIGVFAVGLILSIVQAMKFNIITFPFQIAVAYVGVRMVFDMILISVACLCVMSWLEVSFGSPGPALLKIAGIALVATPIADIISYLIHDPLGLIGRIIALVCIVILLVKMFDMDIADVRILAVIVWAARVFLGPFLLAAMLTAIGVTFAGMGGLKLSQAQLNSDRLVQEKIDMGRMVDAKPWLEDGAHCFGKAPNAVSKKFVDGLLAAGCKTVLIEHSGPFAGELVAELPSSDADRKAAFAAAASFCNDTGNWPPVDKGQTYLDMPFSMYYEPPTSNPSGAPTNTAPRLRRRGLPLGPMNSF